MRGLVTPSLKMKRALVRRTGIPLRRFRAGCEVMIRWNLHRHSALYRWESPDTRGGKSWIGRAYRVTLELRDPKPAFGPEPIVNRGRMRRGATYYTSEGEGSTARDAVEMALVNWDIAGGGIAAVRLKPTPAQVELAIDRFRAPPPPDLFSLLAARMRQELERAYRSQSLDTASGGRLDDVAGMFGAPRYEFHQRPAVQADFGIDVGHLGLPAGHLNPDAIRQRLAEETGIPADQFQIRMNYGADGRHGIDVTVTATHEDADRIMGIARRLTPVALDLSVEV